MGAMNKHPSCRPSWRATTETSLGVSQAFAAVMQANINLERILLAEFAGEDYNPKLGIEMIAELHNSAYALIEIDGCFRQSIEAGLQSVDEYAPQFARLDPKRLVRELDDVVLVASANEVGMIAEKLKQDNLSTTREFRGRIAGIQELTLEVAVATTGALEFARHGELRSALAENRVTLQAPFALLISTWLQFMKEYLVDSVVATEVAFTAAGAGSLAA
jgi:hypothetical protein